MEWPCSDDRIHWLCARPRQLCICWVLGWIGQCFMSPPTQYRLYGRRWVYMYILYIYLLAYTCQITCMTHINTCKNKAIANKKIGHFFKHGVCTCMWPVVVCKVHHLWVHWMDIVAVISEYTAKHWSITQWYWCTAVSQPLQHTVWARSAASASDIVRSFTTTPMTLFVKTHCYFNITLQQHYCWKQSCSMRYYCLTYVADMLPYCYFQHHQQSS